MSIFYYWYYFIFFLIFIGILIILIKKNYKNLSYHYKNYYPNSRNYFYLSSNYIKKYIFLFISCFCLCIALLRPQWGLLETSEKTVGIDIVFVLDVSNSMKAIDISNDKYQINRLEAAKALIKNFAKERHGDRFGLVLFAGESFISCPLTLDNSAFLTFLNSANFNDISKQGTNLALALHQARERFVSGEINENKERGKAIILITDGGDTMDSSYQQVAKSVAEANIAVYTIGLGSEKGVKIPMSQDPWGRITYLQHQGRQILTKLNTIPLKNIAKITNGKFFHAQNFSAYVDLVDELNELPTTILEKQNQQKKEDRYQLFLAGTIFFFCLYLAISYKKIILLKKKIK